MLIVAIITAIIDLAFTIFIPYLIAKNTKGKALKISHLIVCMVLFLIFNGMIANMAIFYCLFKLIGVASEEKNVTEEVESKKEE